MIREYVYTIEETADLMEVNRSTVYRWLRAGRLAGEDIGGVVLIPRWVVEMIKEERGGLVCLNSAARFDKWNRAAVR